MRSQTFEARFVVEENTEKRQHLLTFFTSDCRRSTGEATRTDCVAFVRSDPSTCIMRCITSYSFHESFTALVEVSALVSGRSLVPVPRLTFILILGFNETHVEVRDEKRNGYKRKYAVVREDISGYKKDRIGYKRREAVLREEKRVAREAVIRDEKKLQKKRSGYNRIYMVIREEEFWAHRLPLGVASAVNPCPKFASANIVTSSLHDCGSVTVVSSRKYSSVDASSCTQPLPTPW